MAGLASIVSVASEFMARSGLGGWLVCDYHGMNPVFRDVVGDVRMVTPPCYLLVASQGQAILSHVFECWKKDGGPIPRRTNGVLVADRPGDAVPYGLFGLLDRGTFFIAPGTPVYEGMIVGENNKDNDLDVNACREKKMTNIRCAGRDENMKLPPPHAMSLEECLEYIEDDELVEVTPGNLRLRKRILAQIERKKEARRAARV